MTISEKKTQIVIDNYFKSECDVNTSIRQAFEKGFKIGIKKVPSAEPERKTGWWIPQDNNKISWTASTAVYYYPECSVCGCWADYTNFCPNRGAKMLGEDGEA